MNQSLPSKPSLEHLKKQAKELLAAHKAGDSDALKRFSAYFGPQESLTLASAQLVLAREHGFASWTELKRHIESGDHTLVADFIEAAQGDPAKAAELWKNHRQSLRTDPSAAATAGDHAALKAALAKDPELANKPVGPKDRPLLTYTCFSRLALNPEFEKGIIETAKTLLEAGADANSFYMDEWGGEKFRSTALYGAAGFLNIAPLTKLLLDNCADPNEGLGDAAPYSGEAVYHACDHPGHNECLRLLFEAGASQPARDYCIMRKLDFEDQEGVLLFLQYGANPNNGQPRTALSHALLRNRSIEMIRLLLDNGADPNKADHDGSTPYVLARRYGKKAEAELLAERGANTDLSPYDALLTAAAEGSPEEVKAIAKAHPEVLREASDYGRQKEDGMALGAAGEVLHDLARAGQVAGLKALIELGMNPGTPNRFNETPLHWACVAGRVEAAKALVEAGAPVDVVEKNHGATPLGWAKWGKEYWNEPHGDYDATIAYMEAAG